MRAKESRFQSEIEDLERNKSKLRRELDDVTQALDVAREQNKSMTVLGWMGEVVVVVVVVMVVVVVFTSK